MRYRRSDLSPAIRRLIKRKEQCLNRRCGLIWQATNPQRQTYLFGRFNRGRGDHIIVTLGYHMVDGPFSGENVHTFLPCY